MKLSTQAKVLVIVPLLFELIFVAALFGALHQLEQQYGRQAHSRAVLMSVNMCLKYVLDAAAAAALYYTSKDPKYKERFEQSCGNLLKQNETLSNQVKAKPEGLEEYLAVSQEALDTLKHCEVALESRDEIDTLRSLSKVRHLSAKVSQSSDKVIRAQEITNQEQERAQADTRAFIYLLIEAGVVANILIAAGLVYAFNRKTSRRLDVLMTNTVQLAIEKPLQKPLEGTDEIAKIDRTFHHMANLLSEARRKERAVTENAVDVICSLDDKGKFAQVNKASISLWQYEPDELLGKSVQSLVATEDAEKTFEAIENLIKTKSSGSFENRVKRKDGTFTDTLWSAQWSPEEKSLFCVAHDISQRKQLERLKQEVVAMISHDLRSPLTSLQLTLNLLAQGVYGELNERGNKSTKQAQDSVLRLINMVSDLLDMEKMESGAFQLDRERLQTSEVVTTSFSSVQTSADEKKITLKQEGPDLAVFADQTKLVRVLVNLLSNAIKFSPNESAVTVSMEDDTSKVIFKVSDNGRGIPKEKLETIFERFKQLNKEDEVDHKGSGLGLAICKSIVEAHHGEISAESEIDRGTCIVFSIPKAE